MGEEICSFGVGEGGLGGRGWEGGREMIRILGKYFGFLGF